MVVFGCWITTLFDDEVKRQACLTKFPFSLEQMLTKIVVLTSGNAFVCHSGNDHAMHTVSGSLVACASVNNQEGEAVTRSDSSQFLSRTVSQAEVGCSGDRKDEIRTPSRMLSDTGITRADQPRHISEENESEGLAFVTAQKTLTDSGKTLPQPGNSVTEKAENEDLSVKNEPLPAFGALSCLPPEVLCKIFSFLPSKDFNALLRTAKVCNNNERVRRTYLKCVVEALCHRYFGALKANHKALDSKRRHFSRHMDAALERLRQVAPAGDIDLIETALRREPLYAASLLRMLSNNERLTNKVRSLRHAYRPHVVQGELINLPGTSKLVSVGSDRNRLSRNLAVWDATFDANHLTNRNAPLHDAMDSFLRVSKCAVFSDGRVAMSNYDGIIHIFDFSQSAEPELIRVIQSPEHPQICYRRIEVISDDIIVAVGVRSFLLFDLRRPKGCELFRTLEHCEYYGLAFFSGLLPSGELVSLEHFSGTKLKIWSPIKSCEGGVNVLYGKEPIKEINIFSCALPSYRSMTLNHGGKVALWRIGGSEFIRIYDVNRPIGQEHIGSIYSSTHFAPVVTPDGQLLVIVSGFGCNTLNVWQLTDSLPVLVRLVNISEYCLAYHICPTLLPPGPMLPSCPNAIFSLNLLPDGRILALSRNNIYIVDLAKPEGREVVRTKRIREDKPFRRVKKVTVVSGELSVLAYHIDDSDSIRLFDYYAV